MRPAAILVFLALVTGAACGGGEALCGGAAARLDRPAPAAAGPSIDDGRPLALAPGRPTVVNVWGSWCGPCRAEQPVLNRAAERHPDVGFLGLDVQENPPAGQAFREEFGVAYPSISDPSREIASRLGVKSTPATLVVTADGRMRAVVQGPVGAETLDCMIDAARR